MSFSFCLGSKSVHTEGKSRMLKICVQEVKNSLKIKRIGVGTSGKLARAGQTLEGRSQNFRIVVAKDVQMRRNNACVASLLIDSF